MISSAHSIGRVMAVLDLEDERDALQQMFTGTSWDLQCVRTIKEARALLDRDPVNVIISDCVLPGERGWKDVLKAANAVRLPPPLIVASRSADEKLWTEMLNFGAYDLLLKPFEARPVFAAVSEAWRLWMASRIQRYREDLGHTSAAIAGIV